MGDGKIIGVNDMDEIWFRTGIVLNNSYGTAWKQISGALKYVTVGDGKIMGVNSGDKILFRTGNCPK